jgi:ketosteroid isomerase-like protein
MRRFASLALVGLAACAPAEVSVEQQSAAARQAIEAANAEFTTHANQGHGDIVAKGYTEDGVLMLVNQPVASGRQAIAAAFNGMGAMKASVALTVQSVVAHGPLAVERGTYALTVTPPGAPGPMAENGTYIVHWQKVGNAWLRVADIATSDKPLGPPPAPAPAK